MMIRMVILVIAIGMTVMSLCAADLNAYRQFTVPSNAKVIENNI